MQFFHPEPAGKNSAVYPVFIPFAGCPVRCVFCSQEEQTGVFAASSADLTAAVLAEIGQIAQAKTPARKISTDKITELAFYGGTFTALPLAQVEFFLAEANKLREKNIINQVRCSTRPDALNPELLKKLKSWGLDTIELGLQSFCAEPLAASRRSYSSQTAEQACRMVREAGFKLGIQLMPGMPGMRREHFLYDIERCAEIKPDFTRLYPCMVLEGTALSTLWRQQLFTPWSLDVVLELLPDALLTLWNNGIKVIRVGLAPQKELQKNMLAGPWHPALGQILRSRALFKFISAKTGACKSGDLGFSLYAPQRFQGEFYGHAGELSGAWAGIRLLPANVHWWDKSYFELLGLFSRNSET